MLGSLMLALLIAASLSSSQSYAVDKGKSFDPYAEAESKELERFNKLISKNPKDPNVYFARAKCYLILCEDDKALLDLNRAVELAPKQVGILEQRADLLGQLGRKQEALRDTDLMIKLEPTNNKGYSKRAVVNQSLGRLKEALADCDTAIKLSPPGHFEPLQYKWSILCEMKDEPNALKCLDKLIEKDPNNYSYHLLRSTHYLKQGKYDLAIKDMNAGIKISPNEAEQYIMRGDAYRKMNRYADAIADYSHAIRIDEPRCGRAYYGRSQCERALGQSAESQRDFARAQKLGYEERESQPEKSMLKLPSFKK